MYVVTISAQPLFKYAMRQNWFIYAKCSLKPHSVSQSVSQSVNQPHKFYIVSFGEYIYKYILQ